VVIPADPRWFLTVSAGFWRFFTKANFAKVKAIQGVARRDGFVLAKFRFRAARPFHMNPYYA
jgi:hypothetical protein